MDIFDIIFARKGGGGSGGGIAPVTVMPTSSADTVGKVYIYTGADTAQYQHGSIYLGVEDGGAYSFEKLIGNLKNGMEIVPLTDGDMTMGAVKTLLDEINAEGRTCCLTHPLSVQVCICVRSTSTRRSAF